jgi:hypothetical protein
MLLRVSKYLALILLVLLGIQGISKSKQKSDFHDYYTASQLFSQKKDLYNRSLLENLSTELKLEDLFKAENFRKLQELKGNVGTYIYPPLFAFLLLPLSYFSYETASLLFNLINLFCFIILLKLIRDQFNSVTIDTKIFFSLLVCYPFLESHVINNQVAFILLLLVSISLFSKSNLLSGACLSLAIWIKITPAIFLFYFLYKKDFLKLGYSVLFMIFWFFLPSLFSFEYNLTSSKDWFELVLGNALKSPTFRSWKNNQSLVSTLAKYFLSNADVLNQDQYNLPIFSVSKQGFQIIFYSVSLVIGIPFLIKIYKGIQNYSLISVLFILSVVFSGISWLHSFIFLFIPIFYLIHLFSENILSKIQKYIFLVLCFLIIIVNKNIIGESFDSALKMYSYLLYISLGYYLLFLTMNEDEKRNQV